MGNAHVSVYTPVELGLIYQIQISTLKLRKGLTES
jgi:hypothetical protein